MSTTIGRGRYRGPASSFQVTACRWTRHPAWTTRCSCFHRGYRGDRASCCGSCRRICGVMRPWWALRARCAGGDTPRGLFGAQWGQRFGTGKTQGLSGHGGGAMRWGAGVGWEVVEMYLAHLLSRCRRFWGGRAVQTHASGLGQSLALQRVRPPPIMLPGQSTPECHGKAQASLIGISTCRRVLTLIARSSVGRVPAYSAARDANRPRPRASA